MAAAFKIPPPPELAPSLAYAAAVGLPLAALAVEVSWRNGFEHIPFVLFFFVVAFVASVGGWGPGAVSVVASSVLGYALLATSSSEERTDAALVGAVLFTPVACVIAGFGALVRAGFQERERTAAELQAAVDMRDRFISTASHELRTPLTALLLTIHRLHRSEEASDPPSPERLATLHYAVERQAQRLVELIERMLDVSRLTSGHLHLTLEDVELTAVVEDVAEQFQGALERAGSKLTIDTAARPVVGRWDRVRLEQVASNLIENAVKYGEGKPIHVLVRRTAGTAELLVQDQGAGIAPEAVDRIFGRFERAVVDAGISGFGIGLWLTREIVTALGGTVTVSSTPGRGSLFRVELPLAGPAGEREGMEATG